MKNVLLLACFITVSSCFISQEIEKSFVVYFNTNKHVLNEKSQKKLEAFAKEVKVKHYVIHSIDTYCDTVGSIDFNIVLSDKRLATIDTYFSKNNILIAVKNSNGEVKNEAIKQNTANSAYRKAVISYSLRIDNKDNMAESEVVQENVSIKEAELDRFEEALLHPEKENEAIVLDIQFVGGKAILLPESEPEVESLYLFLARNKEVTALIRGHVCCHSDPILAVERAKKVYSLLIEKGIPQERLTFKGYNNTMPIAVPEVTPEDQQRNRRVDVIFTRK